MRLPCLLAALIAAVLIVPSVATARGARLSAGPRVVDVPPGVTAHQTSLSASAPPSLPAADLDFGAFAGENWDSGAPYSMSGSWRVPKISPDSKPGVAGTWIGIEGPPVDGSDGPFIQVGTNEERDRVNGGSHYVDRYYAFFSDTVLGFSPVALLAVRPGDLMSASLRLHNHRWTVFIRDARSGHSVRFLTRDEGHGTFNQAEWLQEDVTDARTHRPFPYPVLSALTFFKLGVNGARPGTDTLRNTWMNENQAYLGPNVRSADAFTLGPQIVSPIAAQYLGIVIPFDAVAGWFYGQEDDWVPATPVIETSAERSAFAQALDQGSSQLLAATWPAGIAPLISQLVSALQSDASYVQTGPAATAAGIKQWITRLSTLTSANSTGDAIRRALGLPLAFPTPV